MTDDRETDLFADDPVTEPLTYPGRIPRTSGVLLGTQFRPLQAVTGTYPECWQTESTPLSEMIRQQGASPMSSRVPVVAVGSNAAPSQLLRKLCAGSASLLIPFALSEVCNLIPGVSAHVSKPGYIPAAPVRKQNAVSRLFVLWLDSTQLRVLDETEPNYWRRRLPAQSLAVRLESGAPVSECFVYIGKHGCLVDTQGQPRRLAGQRALIQELLSESPVLRKLCGESPEEFVERVQDPQTREAVRRNFVAEGRIWRQPGLRQLTESLCPGGVAPPNSLSSAQMDSAAAA